MRLMLGEAFKIAVEIHGGQRDKAGEPYLFHVMRVADQMDTDEERAVGILHDVLEDAAKMPNPYGEAQVQWLARKILFLYGEVVSDAILALTRGAVEPYSDYILRLSTNPMAVKVKFADLKDNMNPQRLRKLPSAESERLFEKYTQACDFLYNTTEEAKTCAISLGLSPAPYAFARS